MSSDVGDLAAASSKWDSPSDRKSPVEKCPICLGPPIDRCQADNCRHEFCFVCLLEWTKIKSECPLCKQKLTKIYKNFKSPDEFESFDVPEPVPQANTNGRRFRYGTTVTAERLELQRQIRELQLRLMESRAQMPTVAPYHLPFGPFDNNNQGGWAGRARTAIDSFRARLNQRDQISLQRYQRLLNASENGPREQLVSDPEFRRLIYERGLRVRPMTEEEMEGRVRDISPEFFALNPAMIHRLVPWLTRELHVLLAGDPHRVQAATQTITNLILRAPIESDQFVAAVRPQFPNHAEHFVHEFAAFARSPFDMAAYDQRVQYHRPGSEALPVENNAQQQDDVIVEAESVALQRAREEAQRREQQARRSRDVWAQLRERMQRLHDSFSAPQPPTRPVAAPAQPNGASSPVLVDLSRTITTDEEIIVHSDDEYDSSGTRDTWPTGDKQSPITLTSPLTARPSSAGPSWSVDNWRPVSPQQLSASPSGHPHPQARPQLEERPSSPTPEPLTPDSSVHPLSSSDSTPEDGEPDRSTGFSPIFTPQYSTSSAVTPESGPTPALAWSNPGSPAPAAAWSPARQEDSDIEVLCEMKPKHLRTPPVVTLSDADPDDTIVQPVVPVVKKEQEHKREESSSRKRQKKHKKHNKRGRYSSDTSDSERERSQRRKHSRRRSPRRERDTYGRYRERDSRSHSRRHSPNR